MGKEVKKTLHKWTMEEIEYLKEITPGHHYKEIVEMINSKFNLNLTTSQIGNAIKRYKLLTGFNGQFTKGSAPANKGIKGVHALGSEKTWFPKGHKPQNWRPVGSERINVYGYTEVKVKEPSQWKLKHKLIWETENGPVPKGYAVIFGNGDKQDFSIDNLILVSRQQLLILNRNKLIKDDAELTKTGVLIADLHIKIKEASKK